MAEDIRLHQVPGGNDNCIFGIQIGLNSWGGGVSAFFDHLLLEPQINGTDGLEMERELVESRPLELTHHIGAEFSYYGQHINCFDLSITGAQKGDRLQWVFNGRFLHTSELTDKVYNEKFTYTVPVKKNTGL